ncbi:MULTISPECIES: hypothetical protein [Streptomyces]|uniref:Uncharacterized protein n=1 Tax=Streptomyces canarius TaxID=285453 RepID=A0ABQ3D0G2_9ACTN|nr:hypothetical protein [Streptomyces canarius]GHA52501.1 hypothetical protein GCM10010345_66510 [Streptomyces canarius]
MSTAPPVDAPEWDAVRVPRQLGLSAREILGTRAGAVVEDPTRGAIYFFTPAGTADTWDLGNTEALPAGATVPIPPTRRTEGPGPHWRICPGNDGWLTDPAALAAALQDAFRPQTSEKRVG